MKFHLFSISIICLATAFSITAQTGNLPNRKTNMTSSDVRVIKDKAHIFISFERKGKIAPPYIGVSNMRVWLRFHNNSRWKVMFCSGLIAKEYGETEAEYQVERYKGSGETPGTRGSDSCQYLLVSPDKSVLFSVPLEHLAYGLAIKIEFRYEWELDPNGSDDLSEPKHYAYFYSDDIPSK